MKGIVLIAVGNSYYGKAAYNLAVGIKASCSIPICLLHDEMGISHLGPLQVMLFDSMIKLSAKHISRDAKPSYLLSKTYLCELSPFDETVYIDADVMWCPKKDPYMLFGDSFRIACREIVDTSTGTSPWLTLSDIKDKYGFEKWYDVSSEYIFFKKSDIKIFEDARSFMLGDTKMVKFAGDRPDEPGFAVAILLNKIEPENYTPFYWQGMHKNRIKSLPEIMSSYFGLSMGGKSQDRKIKDHYSILKKHYESITKKRLFDHEDKMTVMHQRRDL